MAQKAKKKLAVRVLLDDTVYVVSGQGISKTYISKIVARQWFNKNGEIVQQITYCVPSDEIGEGIANKFVIGDFGVSIFTNYSSALKKFDSLSKYKRENESALIQTSANSSANNKELYYSEGKKKVLGKGEETEEEVTVVNTYNDSEGTCDNNCVTCPEYDSCNKKEKTETKSINAGAGEKDTSTYIAVKDPENDIPRVPPKEINQSIDYSKNGYTYYDSTGSVVTSSTGDFTDASSFVNSDNELATGKVVKIQYKDEDGNLIYRVGNTDNLVYSGSITTPISTRDFYIARNNTGNFVYEDGSYVKLSTKVTKIIELVGDVSTGNSNIASTAETKSTTKIVDAVDDTDTIDSIDPIPLEPEYK